MMFDDDYLEVPMAKRPSEEEQPGQKTQFQASANDYPAYPQDGV
jgi:hypothetical protein